MHKAAILAALLVAFNAHARAQWQIQDAGTTADLRGIDSLGHGVAWASGSKGTVLRTLDMGKTWEHCPTPPNADTLDFRGIQAFDKDTAVVMSSGKGDLSRLYKTTDACKTWRLVFTNPDKNGFWDAIRFDGADPQRRKNPERGVIVGDPVQGRFAIFDTSDSGENWHPFVGKHTQARRDESLFAASNSAADAMGDGGNFAFITGGQGGSYFYTEDPGGLIFDQWMTDPSLHRVALNFPHSTTSEGAFSLSHRRLDNVTAEFMVVGGDYTKPEQSGFAAFLPAPTFSFFMEHQQVERSTTPPHGYRSAVAYDPKTNTWITVGPNGTDLSADDGRNWHPLTPDPKQNDAPDADGHWNALSLPFVVGPHGRIGLRDGTPAMP